MLESEMEDLLWTYPDRFLREPLKPFRRQPRSEVGRADIVFQDSRGGLLVVEIKRGQLKRGAIDQIHDYYGMLKREFPGTPIDMMVVAQSISEDRKLSLGMYHIEYREISEQHFRDVASEVNYVFRSEQQTPVQSARGVAGHIPDPCPAPKATSTRRRSSLGAPPEVVAVLDSYNATAEPGLKGRGSEKERHRQIISHRGGY